MTAGGGTGPAQSADSSANCRLAGKLLQTGQYEQAAAALHTAQEHCAQAGDAFTAHLLDAARRLCLACKQCQEETGRQWQALQETERREQELRQELLAIVELIVQGGTAGISPAEASPHRTFRPETEPAQPAEHLGLWQRIRSLLPGHLAERPPERQPRAEPIELPARPQAHRADALISSPRQMEPTAVAPAPVKIDNKDLRSPSLAVYCLGAFRVYQDNRPVTEWPSSRGKSIFKYMVTHREHPVPKEILMELFWPGADPDAARNNLNVAIYGLRQALRQGRPFFSHVLYQDDCYLLNPELEIWVDCDAFLQHLTTARILEQRGDSRAAIREYRAAEAYYQGEFLEEDLYEDWPAPQRQRMRDDALSLLDRLSCDYLEHSMYTSCIATCRRILDVESCCEEVHRRLMYCYSRQGQPYLALRQYHLCSEVLQEELDMEVAEETTALYEKIRRGVDV